MKILSSRIQPGMIFFTPDDKGGGAVTIEPPPAVGTSDKVGSSFSKMLSDMTDQGGTTDTTDAGKGKESKAAAVTDDSKASKGDKGDDRKASKAVEEVITGDDLTLALKGKPAEGDTSKAVEGDASKAAPIDDTPKSSKDWKAAKARHADELKAEKTQRETIAKEFEDFKKTVGEESERLKKENAELLAIVERIGVERSPTYQNKFVKARNDLITRAAKIVTDGGGDAEKFKSAIQLTGQARNDALEDAMGEMNAFDKAQVANLSVQIGQVDQDRENYIANSKDRIAEDERMAEERQREEDAKLTKARQDRFREIVPTMINLLPEDHPLAKETNPILEQVIKDAEEFLFTASDFNEFSRASIAYKVLPVMTDRLVKAGDQIRSLKAEIKKLTEADPDLENGGGGKGGDTNEPKSFAERFSQASSKLGATAA